MAHAVTSTEAILQDLRFVMGQQENPMARMLMMASRVTRTAITTMFAIQQANVTIHLLQRATSPSTAA